MNTAVNLREKWFSNSDVMFHTKIANDFVKMLRENGYPNSFIESALSFERSTSEGGGRKGNYRSASLLYVGQSSFIIRKFLEKLDPGIRLAFGKQISLNECVRSRTNDRP